MKNVMQKLVNAWYDLLNGGLTYKATPVVVYKEDAANADAFHHVLIRAESETDNSNKTSFVTNPVVIIDIITVHQTSVRRSIVDAIDDQIRELLFPTRQCALPVQIGLQISNVTPQSSSYLSEDDGTKKYYRKITRYRHRINQTT